MEVKGMPTALPGSIFVLSGEELTLPLAEIRALVETYSSNSSVESLARRVVSSSLSDPALIAKVANRAAYCRFGGMFVSKSNDIPSLAEGIDWNLVGNTGGKSFAVDSLSLNLEQQGELGDKIKSKMDMKVSLENPDIVFQAESVGGGEHVLAFTDQGYKKQQWTDRRPRARRFFLPSAIYPKLARLLVNLSRLREGELFVDPFCGTGSLLIEASLMGLRTAGIEITRWIARGAKLNLKGFSLQFESIIRADSTFRFLPFQNIDGIATDVPYGRASSTKGLATDEIIRRFLNCAKDSTNSTKDRKRYCVIMHPSTVNLESQLDEQGNSFELKEQHRIYVHRNLTRVVSILERREKD